MISFYFILLSASLIAQQDDKILNHLLEGKDYKKQISIYDSLVNNLKSNNLPLSIEYMTRAIELAKRNNNDFMAAQALNTRCKLYRHTSEFDKAEADLNESLPVFIKLDNKKWIIQVYTDFGNINSSKGIYDKSISYYLKGLKIAEETGDHFLIAALNNNIGNVYYFEEKYTKAIEYYLKAYEILKTIGDVKGSAMTLDNIGLIYTNLKQFEKALQYQLSALEIIKTLNDKQLLADSYMQLGGLYNEMKLHNKALEYFYEANAIYKETKTKYGLAQSGVNIGDVYRINHKYIEAIAILNESYLMSKETGLLGVSQSAAQNLYQTYEDMNDYKNAYRYYKEFVKLKDSVFNEESIDKINELSAKYETTQKIKEIELLTKDKELNATKLKQKNTLNIFLFSGIALVIVLLSLLFSRFKEKQKANTLLEEKNIAIHEQKALVEEKQAEIINSINYAKRLQGAILLSEQDLAKYFTEIFVLYKPKDIVGGDFYWFSESEDHKILAVADCTGHGVPGGFMSMLGYESLQDVALRKEITTTSQALSSLDKKITDSLNKSERTFRDGMDIALCAFRKKTKTLQYSGANRPLIQISNGVVTEHKPDKHSIGGNIDDTDKIYTTTDINYNSGDVFYMFTDGYADQFGGPKGKKFKIKQLIDILKSISHLDLRQQKEQLNSEFEKWKGELEQVDDVCIIGIRL